MQLIANSTDSIYFLPAKNNLKILRIIHNFVQILSRTTKLEYLDVPKRWKTNGSKCVCQPPSHVTWKNDKLQKTQCTKWMHLAQHLIRVKPCPITIATSLKFYSHRKYKKSMDLLKWTLFASYGDEVNQNLL